MYTLNHPKQKFYCLYNYDNITNYHNDENNKTFISSNSKYTFEYNEDTKTLVVLKGSGVDAVFVDGVKQKGEK